jgi:hypothetical protein
MVMHWFDNFGISLDFSIFLGLCILVILPELISSNKLLNVMLDQGGNRRKRRRL